MMHDNKSDHDSVYAASSPAHSSTGSPKQYPAYYVESPYSSQADNGSRIASGHASPGPNTSSPSDSPRPSYTTFGRPSTLRCSSTSSRSSGNWRYLRINGRQTYKPWPTNECQVITEDGDDDDDFTQKRDIPMPPYIMPVLSFALFLTAFCFIAWSVGGIYKPQISVQSLKVNRLLIGGGSDYTGVPSKFITVNCTAVVSVHNPATFFGIHITSEMAHVMFMEIRVATGNLKGHYLGRTSKGNVTMEFYGSRVPLYGAGAALHDGRNIPLKLDMELQTRGYIIGRLVKTTHTRHITCSFAFSEDSADINTRDSSEVNLKRHSCTYK